MKINPSDPSSVQLFHWKCISCQGNRQDNLQLCGSNNKNRPSVPCGRFHHAACSQGKFVYILGGKDRYSPLKDFWRLDIVNEKWEQIDDKKTVIPHLEGHTMLSYKSEILIFGGTFCDTGDDTPLWIFNTDLFCIRKWYEPSSLQPSGRREHSAVIYKNSMYIYGGFLDNSGSTDEFWLFNIEEEIWQKIPRSQPGKRHGHITIVATNNMWLHGGMKELAALADLWVYNFNLCTWTKIKGQGTSPTLANHTGHVFDRWLILLGGTHSGQLLHDIWLFRFDTQTWTQISPQHEDIYPPLSLHASVLMKTSAIKSQHVDQVKSLPQLTSTSVLTPCESVRPHTASNKYGNKCESSSDTTGSFVLPLRNTRTVTMSQHDSCTTSHVPHKGAEILKLNYFNGYSKSEGAGRQSDAETSFSHEPVSLGPSQIRSFDRIPKSSTKSKKKQINTRPGSGELVLDSLPLLQRFYSTTSDDDLGVNNLSVTISDEQVNVSTNLAACSFKSTISNSNPLKRNVQHDTSKRKVEKYQVRTSLMKKVYKQKTSKNCHVGLKEMKPANKSESNFENPFYSVLFDDMMNLEDSLLAKYTSSHTSNHSKPYDKVAVRSQSNDDLLVEDLEWLDYDQLFKATIPLHPSSSRIRSSSFKDISNYALNVSDFETSSFAAIRVKRQNSKSCDNLISESRHQCLSATGLEKELSFSGNNFVQSERKNKFVSSELCQNKSENLNCTDSHLITSWNFSNKLYTLQNSVGVQTSDSLLMLDKPRAQTADSVYSHLTANEMAAVASASKLTNKPAKDKTGILGESELCILVLGGQSEYVSFKSEPLKLWKCHLN